MSADYQDLLDFGKGYVDRKWTPIPVAQGSKRPRGAEWQKTTHSHDVDLTKRFKPGDNMGLLLGDPSARLVDVDIDDPRALPFASRLLPHTERIHGRETSPSSHYWYILTDTSAGETERILDPETNSVIVELRANGGQTVVPPSVHPDTNENLVWERDGDPGHVDRVSLLNAIKTLAATTILVKHWPKDGGRHNATMALAGMLARSPRSNIDVAKMVVSCICEATGDNDLEDRLTCVDTTFEKYAAGENTVGTPALAKLIPKNIVARIRELFGTSEDATVRVGQDYTDIGNAELFASEHKGAFRFCTALGKETDAWMVWDGMRWKPDTTKAVMRAATDTLNRQWDRAKGLDEKARKWATQSRNVARIDAMVKLARSRPGIPADITEFDEDPLLLNTLSGVVNLRTGELRPHDPAFLITRLAPTVYNPEAKAPLFEKFLDEIMLGDAGMVAFLKRAFGYSLTGDISEQSFFILHGSGSNGKSALLGAVGNAIGDYAVQAQASVLLRKKEEGPGDDVARLRGARLVTATETDDGKRLAEAMVKQLTGGEKIAARELYSKAFEFVPTFKLWLGTNHKPVISGTDDGIWRRIKLVPFDLKVPAEKRDKKLPEKLRKEAEGILAWMVAGCLEWQRLGLDDPAKVVAANSEYRNDEDPVAQFIQELCEMAGETPLADVYEAYVVWVKAAGNHPFSKKRFAKLLRQRGTEVVTGEHASIVKGLKLRERRVSFGGFGEAA